MTGSPSGATARYLAAARALDAFFARRTASFCADCFEVVRAACPDDPRARMDVSEGLFPGCCQTGADRDFTVPARGGENLPAPFVAAFQEARRERFGPPGEVGRFVLVHRDTGERKVGRGCAHLAPGGCRLGPWKSLLCLRFVCQPLLDDLAARAPAVDWGDSTDFLGVSALFAEIAGEEEVRAEAALSRLLALLADAEAHLDHPSTPRGKGSPDHDRLERL